MVMASEVDNALPQESGAMIWRVTNLSPYAGE